jgi:glycine cleavage system regulatory protein
MKTTLVLSLIGPDKAGLVEMLSKTLANRQANWLECSMSQLAGKFAGLLTVNIDSDQVEALTQDLNQLGAQGLKVTTESCREQQPEKQLVSLTLELVGHDKHGLIRDISQALSQNNIRFDNLHTEIVSGSMSAEPMFKATAQLLAPKGLDYDKLQESLEGIAPNMMVDITINA